MTLSAEMEHELRCMGDFAAKLDQNSSHLCREVLHELNRPSEEDQTHWARQLQLAQEPLREQERIFYQLHAELRSFGQVQGDHVNAVQALAKAKRDMEAALAAMDSTLAEMKDKRAFKEAKIKEMEANLAQEGTDLNAKGDELRASCERYKKFLGLDVSLTDQDTIAFELSRIDIQDPERRFRCELTTSREEGQKAFTVVRCIPELENVSALEDLLNETRDLSGFVVALRKKFRQTCN